MAGTTVGRTVFVLGREVDGNRQAVIIEASQAYDLSLSAVEAYTDQTARFPYEL